MSQKDAETGHALLVATLSQARTHRFEIIPDEAQRRQLATELGLSALRKLRFTGEIRSAGKRDWLLDGTLGATVVQPCVQTLAPVTTRIDTEVSRRFVPLNRAAKAKCPKMKASNNWAAISTRGP